MARLGHLALYGKLDAATKNHQHQKNRQVKCGSEKAVCGWTAAGTQHLILALGSGLLGWTWYCCL
jgi:hypothetical protein